MFHGLTDRSEKRRIARDLPFEVEMTNASGRTSTGDSYRRVFLSQGILAPAQSIDVALRFRRHRQPPPVSFSLLLLSDQGIPSWRGRPAPPRGGCRLRTRAPLIQPRIASTAVGRLGDATGSARTRGQQVRLTTHAGGPRGGGALKNPGWLRRFNVNPPPGACRGHRWPRRRRRACRPMG